MSVSRRSLIRNLTIGIASTLLPGRALQATTRRSVVVTDTRLDEFLREWADLGEWTKVRCAAPGPGYHATIMHAMSRTYVKDYFAKHARLPTGTHCMEYRCGPDPENEVLVSVRPNCMRSGTITYPGDCRRAKKL